MSTGRVDLQVGSGQDFCELQRVGSGRVDNSWKLAAIVYQRSREQLNKQENKNTNVELSKNAFVFKIKHI